MKIFLISSMLYNIDFIFYYFNLKKVENAIVCEICESRLPFTLDLSKLHGLKISKRIKKSSFEKFFANSEIRTNILQRAKNYNYPTKGKNRSESYFKKIIFNPTEINKNNPCRYDKFGPRILCAVFTHKEAHGDIKYIQNTWGRR